MRNTAWVALVVSVGCVDGADTSAVARRGHRWLDAGSPVSTDVAAATDAVAAPASGAIYPTIAGGREWQLPSDAQTIAGEWQPETDNVLPVAPGEFQTAGANGEVRLTTHSAAGHAWWRNLEMTGYFRYAGDLVSNGQVQHFELVARSERHWAASNISGTSINDGVAAPAGTVAWPGYPFGSQTIDWHCLGASYHANVYLDGNVAFEKELTHIAGYAPQRGQTKVAGFVPGNGGWFGMKFVVRNAAGDTRTRLELWIDAAATGTWTLASTYEDAPGVWAASDARLDGCTSLPFAYTPDQTIGWAGPWLMYRSDSIVLDFRDLSAREIAPLP